MSALGMASLGTQCSNVALGMASLGVFCDTVIQVPDTGAGARRSRINQDAIHRKRLLREDDELITIILSAISSGVIR